MAAAITFFGGQGTPGIGINSSSGLGFYGANFGASVAVGSYQGTTFITNAAGTALGPQVSNITFVNAQSGVVDSATSGINLLSIPNNQASLKISFTYDSAVKTQNVKFRIYDRVSIDRPASGVTTKVAELIHPGTTQIFTGSGDNVWHHFSGLIADSGHFISLADSPGSGGEYAGNGTGGTRTDLQHNWYLAISCSPDNIGSKLFAGYISLEYL